ncbi:hypothetical protein OGAPHI_002665 [Ogataea philodendri]|uniref:Uncharacterized protein n=1 Tax=Ogataea philodendri TaxID=1378263 RepID=A0A9P8PC05_9ASCO|nr:uncharacterized protein OGAPHI_002665 [Ogataea philodendri]KAH3668910.1 hypothetical protein OGAPHI_002665 [Ogataea philodendri]
MLGKACVYVSPGSASLSQQVYAFEKIKDSRVRVADVVIVHNSHQSERLVQGREEFCCLGLLLVFHDGEPLVQDREQFVFPGQERDAFHDGWLNNLASRETAPDHGRHEISPLMYLEVNVARSFKLSVAPSSVRKLVPVGCSCNVGELSVFPEDWSDVLVGSVWIQRLSPWLFHVGKLLIGDQVQALKNHQGRFLQVHGVEMEMVHLLGVQQLLAHLDHQFSTNVSDLGVVVLDRVQSIAEMLWDGNLRPAGSSHERSVGTNRHDSRNDRNGDSQIPAIFTPVDEVLDIVEHLCDNEVCSGILFLLQMLKSLGTIWFFWVSFRIACNTNAEVVAIVLLDMADQILSIHKVAGRLRPVNRWIASKSQNVLTTTIVGRLQSLVDQTRLHVSTCQMHTGLQPKHCGSRVDHFRSEGT